MILPPCEPKDEECGCNRNDCGSDHDEEEEIVDHGLPFKLSTFTTPATPGTNAGMFKGGNYIVLNLNTQPAWPRTKRKLAGWGLMEKQPSSSDGPDARLRQRMALNLMLDEFAIDALAQALSVLREADDPEVPDLEHAVRTQRISIMKQRAIFGAAGIDV
ncbi:hypothetical protein MKK68_08215 [Methylobacterium sp. E-016]|uniref:hypothetical protein n=1 Tax=Methylobacterium sp. E-016 TaxID=2836556 RepID=UPI001FBA733B|nr:hypothetical protein [Methylobacterium sp. E-016]MCJ2075636.1 hypothetical protein [Methylobacterium sp. E-016]